MTPADESLIKELKLIKAALGVGGKGNTLIEVLTALAVALGLKLTVKYAQETQPDGKRPRLVRNDPGVYFERRLPGVAEKWLVSETMETTDNPSQTMARRIAFRCELEGTFACTSIPPCPRHM